MKSKLLKEPIVLTIKDEATAVWLAYVTGADSTCTEAIVGLGKCNVRTALRLRGDRLYATLTDALRAAGIEYTEWSPEPTLRPWKAHEVPVGKLMRSKNPAPSPIVKTPWVILGVSHRGTIQFPGKDNEIHGDTFQQALDLREHSIDGGKTWLDCGIKE